MKAIELFKKFETIKQEKQNLVTLMNNVDNFFDPSDAILTGEEKVSTNVSSKKGELLDTTGTRLMTEFVANVLGLYFNTEIPYFTIEHPLIDPYSDDGKVLKNRAKTLYRLISKSNYYSVCPQHEWDTLVHGHGLMIIEKDKDEFARCYTKKPTYVYMVESEEHKVIEMYWLSQLTVAQFKYKYPEAKLPPEVQHLDQTRNRYIEIINCITPNNEFYTQGLETNKKIRGKNIYRVITGYSLAGIEGEAFLKSKPITSASELKEPMGVAENRFCPSRDRPSRTNPYGSGMGRRILPLARILNKLTRDALLASGKSANPPRVISSEIKKKLQNTNEIGEGELMEVDETGFSIDKREKYVETLDVSSDINGTVTLIQMMQEQIASFLPTTSQTYKVSRQSIQEIQQRLRDQQKRLGPLRSHYLKESTSAHLRRFYDIAKENGYFETEELAFSDPALDKQTPMFSFDALLLQSHRLTESLQLAQALGQSQNLLAIAPGSSLYIDEEKAIKSAFLGNGVSQFLRTDKEVQEMKEKIAEQERQQQAIQENQINAQSLAQGGNAMKAMTEALVAQKEQNL